MSAAGKVRPKVDFDATVEPPREVRKSRCRLGSSRGGGTLHCRPPKTLAVCKFRPTRPLVVRRRLGSYPPVLWTLRRMQVPVSGCLLDSASRGVPARRVPVGSNLRLDVRGAIGAVRVFGWPGKAQIVKLNRDGAWG